MSKKTDTDQLFQLFSSKASAVAAEVHRFAAVSEAVAFIHTLLQELGVADRPGAYALWPEGGAVSQEMRGALSGCSGLYHSASRERAADALVGISEADWALADTGTLVQDQSAAEQRLVSSLTTVHVAVVGTARILPDKTALLSKIDPRKSRFIAFITGPSRTADIERVLTIGVHGPKRLIILVVDDLGGAVL